MAGLKTNDVVTAVDGEAVTSFSQLKSIIYTHEPGDKITFTIKRKSGDDFKESTRDATLVEFPDTSDDGSSPGSEQQMPDFEDIFGQNGQGGQN